MNREHQEKAIVASIEAIYDAAAALNSVAVLQADPGGRAQRR